MFRYFSIPVGPTVKENSVAFLEPISYRYTHLMDDLFKKLKLRIFKSDWGEICSVAVNSPTHRLTQFDKSRF